MFPQPKFQLDVPPDGGVLSCTPREADLDQVPEQLRKPDQSLVSDSSTRKINMLGLIPRNRNTGEQ